MSNLLESRSVPFLELIGNGKLYRVPPFQRDYSWTQENWEALWQDILAVREAPGNVHYMGAVVMQSVDGRHYQIIDGQQRFATLSLLVVAVLRRLQALAASGVEAEENGRRVALLRDTFLGYTDPGSLTTQSKLSLNRTNNDFYQDYLLQLVEPPLGGKRDSSNKLLWTCTTYFAQQLAGLPELANDGAGLASLLNDVIARRLLFIQITVDDEVNAYTVFETLNARGVELSATDLLKNYLFSLVRPQEDLLRLERSWHRIIYTVRADRFPEFLRNYLQTRHRKVRKEGLFRRIRGEVCSAAEAFELLQNLEHAASLYAALRDPDDELWQGSRTNRQYLRELVLFRATQALPLLMAAHPRFSPEDFTRLLKLVVAMTFRHTVVSGRNPSELEFAYNDAAMGVTRGEFQTPRAVFQSMAAYYVADDPFRANFAYLSIDTGKQKRRLVRYILLMLESQASGAHRDFADDPGTIEHILPESPSEAWNESWTLEAQDACRYRLGNLTLLEASINRDLGQADFETKREAYARSQYALSRGIVAPEWTQAALTHRQEQLAEQAARLWRADFA